MNKSILLFIWFTLHSVLNYSQTSLVKGTVKCQGKNIKYAKILLLKTAHNTLSDTSGNFELNLIKKGNYTLKISSLEFDAYEQKLTIDKDTVNVFIEINPVLININEVVVTGTMKEINRLESLIPVEVYNPTFFKKNPSPSLFESLQNINGIRPQLNCAICNTGDIHMNGLEGPYTLVLIVFHLGLKIGFVMGSSMYKEFLLLVRLILIYIIYYLYFVKVVIHFF